MRVLLGVLCVSLMLSGCLESGPDETFRPINLSHAPVDGKPLDVLFRIEVDGDVTGLEWTLDAEGDGLPDAAGTTLPAEVIHSFEEPGNYTAVATLTGAGTDQDVRSDVVVLGVEPVVLEGTTSVVSGPQKRGTGHLDCLGFQSGQNGLDCVWFPLDGLDGWTFKADSDGPPADVEFLTVCNARDTESLGIFTDNARGKVPGGAGCALLWDFGPSPATMTLTLTP